MAAHGFREVVVELVDLVESRLRAIDTEAQGEERLGGVGAVDGDGGNARRRSVLRCDRESEAGGLNHVLRFDRVKVEAGVMNFEVVDGRGGDRACISSRELVNRHGS